LEVTVSKAPLDEAAPQLRSGRELRRLAVSVLVASYLLTFVVRYGTAVVLPELRADLGAGEVALAALAAAYFWPYALMQPVAGVLADAWGVKRTVPVFLAAAAAGTALFAVAPSFPVALLGRALGGAGVGIVYICGISLIAQWVSEQRFGTAAGLFSASGILGGFVAARPLEALARAVGWRAAFGLIAGSLLIAALVAALVIPGRRPGGADARPRPLRGLRAATQLRNVWLTGAYAFTVLGILSSMQGLWTIPFLMDVYDLERPESASILEALSLGLIVGIPFWGVVADRLVHSAKWTILASLAVQTPVWGFLAAAPTACPPGLLYVLFLAAGFSNGCWMPAYALVRSTAPAGIEATALGLLNFAFFAGAALFQQGSGVLLGQFSRGADDSHSTSAYQALFAGFAIALLVAALCVVATRERGRPDESRR
jgi:predicted MFS family arabinose efflux permease